jgi:predicted O-linked N-acetylglucosamine transferase (SPINDLY family)
MSSDLAGGREALLEGRPGAAAPIFAAAVDSDPADHEARYWLASALMLLGDPEGADQALNDARTLHALAAAQKMGADLSRLKADPDYANTVAAQLYGQGCVAMASVVWGLAIAAGRREPQMWANYALALQHQGRVEEASSVYRATAEDFSSPAIHQFLVYAELFCEDGERRHAVAARAWADLYARVPAPAPHANPVLGARRLRVGYLAPSFAGSQLRQFITPILENHDPKAVEVVLYPTDASSEADWPSWIKVHPIGQLSDADAAALIRRDGIDILNDCWGHTAGSRLGVFARKPAPVQAAWINFFQTTGLPQMDFVLHAASDDPPAGAELFTEKLWPLGPVFTPFRPAAGRLPPAATPALATGRITFGSFNHPAKLSPAAMSVWAELLRNKPDAQLLLKYRYFADPVLQRATQTQFAARGVAPERVVFASHSSGEDYFKAFQAVDLMLDSWPAPGSTTTLEALSNGVPVLAMVGQNPNVGGFYARTILEAVGLADLATDTPEVFVARALELVEDVGRLDRLRARVRPGFDASAICDEAGFCRGLERAYAQMFEHWRGGFSAGLAAIPEAMA